MSTVPAGLAPVAEDRLAGLGQDPRVYVLPEARVVFTALNKNACTSLKWMVAQIAGEDLGSFKAGIGTYTTDRESIHNRRLWKRALTMNLVDPAIRAGIHPDNGWLIFAVVRDPRSRMFSAWQNKLLFHNAGYAKWRREPWYPRDGFDAASIVAEFARFVDALDADPSHPLLLEDNHFRSQTRLLRLDHLTYSRIYDISEIAAAVADVQAHLATLGLSAPEFPLERANDTPLKANASVIDPAIRGKIERIYAEDFERFGDRWDFTKIAAARAWTQADLDQASVRATLGQRITELRELAVTHRRRAEKEHATALELRELGERLQARNAELEWKLRSDPEGRNGPGGWAPGSAPEPAAPGRLAWRQTDEGEASGRPRRVVVTARAPSRATFGARRRRRRSAASRGRRPPTSGARPGAPAPPRRAGRGRAHPPRPSESPRPVASGRAARRGSRRGRRPLGARRRTPRRPGRPAAIASSAGRPDASVSAGMTTARAPRTRPARRSGGIAGA